MREQHSDILTYISSIFLCISFVLYILYGKNLLKNQRLFFVICFVFNVTAIAGLFINQTIAIVSSSLLFAFISLLMTIKVMNKQKLKSVGLRSYRSFTVN